MLETAAAAAAIARNHGALVARMSAVFEDMRAAFERSDNAAYRVLDGEYHQAMIELSGNPYISGRLCAGRLPHAGACARGFRTKPASTASHSRITARC